MVVKSDLVILIVYAGCYRFMRQEVDVFADKRRQNALKSTEFITISFPDSISSEQTAIKEDTDFWY